MTDAPDSQVDHAAIFRQMTLDHIEYLEQYCAAKEPGGSLLSSLSPEAMRWIGYIVSQWSGLEAEIQGQISWLKNYPNVPEELRTETARHEFRHRLRQLRKLAEHALPGQRTNALVLYERTLSRVSKHKLVRDSLVHGTYALQGNQGFDGVTVHYKGKHLAYRTAILESTALGIGKCTGFFLNFHTWNHAPETKAQLLKSLEQGLPGTIVVTPTGPSPPLEPSAE